MIIGNVQLKNNLIFAPLAGFSDVGFRHLCARYGAGMTVTEMVSAKGMCYGNKGTDALLLTTDAEKIKCVQIFGSEPEFMFRAAKDERLAKFDIIDINMGCPVRKVVGNGDGSALMANPALITEIVAAVKEGGRRPVTVKMRSGIKTGEVLAVECARAAERGGADMIAIHPRFREQFYSGNADHSVSAEVKKAVIIPVVANGDITDAESLDKVKKESGADGFMIGRGALGKPYIFAELMGGKVGFSKSNSNMIITENDDNNIVFDIKSAVLEHIDILRRFFPDHRVANNMKLHLCHYAKDTGNAKAVRSALSTVKDLDGIFGLIDFYF